MHIADGFLPPWHAAAWTVAAAPFVVHGARRVVEEVRRSPETRMLVAGASAVTFVLSALKVPVGGSSSHPSGTGAGVVVLGPPVMAVAATVVLLLQALLLAHGGVTTLGANVMAMGVVGPWAGWLAWSAVRRLSLRVALFSAVAVADLATYATTAVQLGLAHPAAHGGVWAGIGSYAALLAVTQVPLAVAQGALAAVLAPHLGPLAGWQRRRETEISERDAAGAT